MLKQLSDDKAWQRFIKYKEAGENTSKAELLQLKSFVENKEYLNVASRLQAGNSLSVPIKKQISKMSSEKKRTVYVYPAEENMVLKLLTYLLIRKYDHIFSNGLYSFRPSICARDAVVALVRCQKGGMYSYKVDISNYFNSVDVNILLPILKEVLADDVYTYNFFETMLTDTKVEENGNIISENKGIMAGTPTASFLANLYLKELDREFAKQGIPYARYSDDIIVFAYSKEEIEAREALIKSYLSKYRLFVNERKEKRTLPNEKWDFLGFSYQNGKIDISDVSIAKLKAKMYRKSKALLRWKRKKGLDNIKAAKAFVKVFNRKLYENTVNGEITWTRWYFPVINTSDSLKVIDAYMQDCIRYIVTEKRTKKRFDFSYDDIKSLGYRSLVHEYYKIKSQKDECNI